MVNTARKLITFFNHSWQKASQDRYNRFAREQQLVDASGNVDAQFSYMFGNNVACIGIEQGQPAKLWYGVVQKLRKEDPGWKEIDECQQGALHG
jgi:hypothetical protein